MPLKVLLVKQAEALLTNKLRRDRAPVVWLKPRAASAPMIKRRKELLPDVGSFANLRCCSAPIAISFQVSSARIVELA
jgi:hypothetical protein